MIFICLTQSEDGDLFSSEIVPNKVPPPQISFPSINGIMKTPAARCHHLRQFDIFDN